MIENQRNVQVVDYLDKFMVALREQLLSDAERWHDSWLCQPNGQEKFVIWKFIQYYKKFRSGAGDKSMPNDVPMPWLKIAGYALICWIRENHPEILPKDIDCYDPGVVTLEELPRERMQLFDSREQEELKKEILKRLRDTLLALEQWKRIGH